MNIAAERHYLCINAGSSSLKLALYAVAPNGAERRLCEGSALEIGLPESAIEVGGHIEHRPLADHRAALEALLEIMALPKVDAVGHRVVHGGNHTRPERVTPELLTRLEALTPLAPLHNPPALAGIRAVTAHLPDTPQVACFDTAFHATLPEVAHTLPLARCYRELGLRRYGFHGLSYEYITRKLGEQAKGRVVIAHLGNGASLAALRDGRSVDTTMGLTPTGGVMMGTRSGDLDPGVLLYLMREPKLDTAELERAVNREAGLLGVSGTSSDMAELLAADTPDARLAVALFAYEVRKAIGALAAALGGLDRLVFTGGIGEHAAPVRWAICRGLEHLGVELDAAANTAGAALISTPQSVCPVHVMATDEDAMIARHVYELLETANAK
jgi:acetate kinase